MRSSKSTSVLALVAAVLLATSACLALSIESSGPVKVTHRNSGPRYDIDEDFDRAKLTPVSEQAQQAPKATNDKPQEEDGSASSSDQDPTMPVGHVSIRRIFLVPMMHPPKRFWREHEAESSEHPALSGPRPSPNSDDVVGQPGMFAKPFWPFLTPARPAHPHHLFGADEASRSPSAVSRQGDDQDKAASGAEREDDQGPMRPPMFDPIQMMVDMMHQAINSQLMPQTPNLTDLNKEASSPKSGSESSDKASEERPQMPGDVSKPIKPTSHNETHEDIVEIDGKKYLRKTVVNRHVGENIIFMTKRLIFVPLNETESTATESNEKPAITTTTTVGSVSSDKAADAPTSTATPVTSEETTTVKVAEATQASSEAPVDNKKSTDSKPIEESAPTTTVVSKEPTTTTTTSSPEPSAASTVESVETTTKAKASWVDRVTDAVDKAAERLVEDFKPEPATSSSTVKPAGSN